MMKKIKIELTPEELASLIHIVRAKCHPKRRSIGMVYQ
jgi:hypothetical protein